MKKTLFFTLAVLLTIYFASCKDDTITGGGGNETPSISGKIENWHLGSDKKLYLLANAGDTVIRSFILDSCNIDSLGNFTINLKAPVDSMLMYFRFNDSLCTHHSIISPMGVRYCYSEFLVKGSSTSYLGSLSRSNDSVQLPYTGKIFAYSYYFNAGGSITGTDTCNYGQPVMIEHNEVTQTRGWNSLFVVYDSVTSNVIRVSITTQPHTVQWYFSGIYDKNENLGKIYRRNPYFKGR